MKICWDLTSLMGIQTMGSQDVGSKQPQLQSLARQNSMYNLTLDEVQTHLGDLGKPLTSMNLDELLKSVLTVESNHDVDQSSLKSQSSLPLTGALSKKTVDEVWRDIQQKEKNGNNEKTLTEKQPTLGEITLEDFLSKAGVLMDSPLDKNSDRSVASVELSTVFPFSPQGQQIQYHQSQYQQNMIGGYMTSGQAIAQTVPMGAATHMEVPYIENQMTFPSPLMGALSDTPVSSRKRFAAENPMDKTVERRQKRMIKNRESAARSRARKQAYTTELETKVSHLQAENERLKKWKELMKLLPCEPPPEPKYQLRRTSSSTF